MLPSEREYSSKYLSSLCIRAHPTRGIPTSHFASEPGCTEAAKWEQQYWGLAWAALHCRPGGMFLSKAWKFPVDHRGWEYITLTMPDPFVSSFPLQFLSTDCCKEGVCSERAGLKNLDTGEPQNRMPVRLLGVVGEVWIAAEALPVLVPQKPVHFGKPVWEEEMWMCWAPTQWTGITQG